MLFFVTILQFVPLKSSYILCIVLFLLFVLDNVHMTKKSYYLPAIPLLFAFWIFIFLSYNQTENE